MWGKASKEKRNWLRFYPDSFLCDCKVFERATADELFHILANKVQGKWTSEPKHTLQINATWISVTLHGLFTALGSQGRLVAFPSSQRRSLRAEWEHGGNNHIKHLSTAQFFVWAMRVQRHGSNAILLILHEQCKIACKSSHMLGLQICWCTDATAL